MQKMSHAKARSPSRGLPQKKLKTLKNRATEIEPSDAPLSYALPFYGSRVVSNRENEFFLSVSL
jgi:hypothetical protein